VIIRRQNVCSGEAVKQGSEPFLRGQEQTPGCLAAWRAREYSPAPHRDGQTNVRSLLHPLALVRDQRANVESGQKLAARRHQHHRNTSKPPVLGPARTRKRSLARWRSPAMPRFGFYPFALPLCAYTIYTISPLCGSPTSTGDRAGRRVLSSIAHRPNRLTAYLWQPAGEWPWRLVVGNL